MPEWLDRLKGTQHYTCTSNKELESTPGSQRERVSYDALLPRVTERLGRPPADHNELVMVSEQILRQKGRKLR